MLHYNRTKGAGDHADKLVRTYTCQRKSHRWQKIFFQNHLNIAAYNAAVVFSLRVLISKQASQNEVACPWKDWLQTWSLNLSKTGRSSDTSTPSWSWYGYHATAKETNSLCLLSEIHWKEDSRKNVALAITASARNTCKECVIWNTNSSIVCSWDAYQTLSLHFLFIVQWLQHPHFGDQ